VNPDYTALNSYIDAQRQSGISDVVIHQTLLSSGWPLQVVNVALGVSTQLPPNPPIDGTQSYIPSAQNTTSGFWKGRLSRLGFLMSFMYVLAYFLLAIILAFVGHGARVLSLLETLMGLIGVIAAIPITISVHVRRWHDIDQSGWMTLLGLIPFIGLLITTVLLVLPGTKGPNRFGPTHQASLAPKDVFGLS
jgi:uncharacterized membrane protein YhaH (DUF805 family)